MKTADKFDAVNTSVCKDSKRSICCRISELNISRDPIVKIMKSDNIGVELYTLKLLKKISLSAAAFLQRSRSRMYLLKMYGLMMKLTFI